MVQRTAVKGINRYGRSSQGVRVMNMKDDDTVSAVALVMDNDDETSAAVADGDAPEPTAGGALPDGNGATPEPDLAEDEGTAEE
jgi:DNA gyrase subunit A